MAKQNPTSLQRGSLPRGDTDTDRTCKPPGDRTNPQGPVPLPRRDSPPAGTSRPPASARTEAAPRGWVRGGPARPRCSPSHFCSMNSRMGMDQAGPLRNPAMVSTTHSTSPSSSSAAIAGPGRAGSAAGGGPRLERPPGSIATGVTGRSGDGSSGSVTGRRGRGVEGRGARCDLIGILPVPAVEVRVPGVKADLLQGATG